MKLTKRQISSVAVVNVEGKLVGGPEGCEKFHELFHSLIDSGHRHVVVNLGKTPWASSQGVGMLIGAHTSLKNRGGELVLADIQDRIRDILDVTKLTMVFHTCKTEGEAVAYLEGRSSALAR